MNCIRRGRGVDRWYWCTHAPYTLNTQRHTTQKNNKLSFGSKAIQDTAHWQRRSSFFLYPHIVKTVVWSGLGPLSYVSIVSTWAQRQSLLRFTTYNASPTLSSCLVLTYYYYYYITRHTQHKQSLLICCFTWTISLLLLMMTRYSCNDDDDGAQKSSFY